MNTKDSLLKKSVFIEVNILFKFIFSFDTDVPIMIYVILFTEKDNRGSKKLMKNISFKRLSKLNSRLLLATFHQFLYIFLPFSQLMFRPIVKYKIENYNQFFHAQLSL